jgi:hypothetical protein
MSEKLKVIAIDGIEYPKEECRKIKGLYYKIGDINVMDSGQCYFINGKYYKSDTGYIVYDHKMKQYVIKNSALLVENGVIDIVDEQPILGCFSADMQEEPIILNYKGVKYVCLNENIFKKSFVFKESLSDGEYYDRTERRAISFIEPVSCDQNFKNKLLYDSKGVLSNPTKKYNELFNTPLSETILLFGDIVKDYTFGLEFETIKGMIPTRVLDKLGLIPLRDGSINGLEFVTIPLQGPKGLQTIVDVCKELNKRTSYDINCAFHIHIGNVPRTEKFFIAFCRLLSVIEDEMYLMFPLYKKVNYGIKKKSYSKPFPFVNLFMKMDDVINESNVTRNFNILYKYLAMGENYPGDLSYVTHHSSDPHGNAKWNIKTRYHWINLIPLLFGNKQTVEFRVHTSTYDYNKIINFLLISLSIVDTAIKYEDNILKNKSDSLNWDLSNIFYDYCRRCNVPSILSDRISAYITERKNYIAQCINNQDIIADEDNFQTHSFFDWGSTALSTTDSNIKTYKYKQIDFDPIPLHMKIKPIVKKKAVLAQNLHNIAPHMEVPGEVGVAELILAMEEDLNAKKQALEMLL